METIYQVKGSLLKDFVGQISYTVCLASKYEKLNIGFTFDKQRYTQADITPELKESLTDYCLKHYNLTAGSDQELEQVILGDMKTEIHTLATLNDKFIGCVHKQLTERNMYFTATQATDGCIPQPDIEGVLRVTILVFNVLMDDTQYTLTVSAE